MSSPDLNQTPTRRIKHTYGSSKKRPTPLAFRPTVGIDAITISSPILPQSPTPAPKKRKPTQQRTPKKKPKQLRVQNRSESPLTDLESEPEGRVRRRSVRSVSSELTQMSDASDSSHLPELGERLDEDLKRLRVKTSSQQVQEPEVQDSESESEEIEVPFVPNTCPDAIKGEYVYFLKYETAWPGIIRDFLPAQKSSGHDKWLIKDATHKSRTVKKRRHEFFTMSDEGFATCQVGHIERHDVEEEEPTAETRSVTPDLPSEDMEAFSEWSFQQQLVAIRPHLARVIKEDYPPLLPRTELFYKDHRKITPPSYGDISSNTIVRIFLPELRRWVGTSPRGTKRYNAMDSEQQTRYINSILSPAAICQICYLSQEKVEGESEQEAWDRVESDLKRLAEEDVNQVVSSLIEERKRVRIVKGLPEEGIESRVEQVAVQTETPLSTRSGRRRRV